LKFSSWPPLYLFGVCPSGIWSGGRGPSGSIHGRFLSVIVLAFALDVSVPATEAQDLPRRTNQSKSVRVTLAHMFLGSSVAHGILRHVSYLSGSSMENGVDDTARVNSQGGCRLCSSAELPVADSVLHIYAYT